MTDASERSAFEVPPPDQELRRLEPPIGNRYGGAGLLSSGVSEAARNAGAPRRRSG
jgi:hypothetical protein